MDKEQRGVFGQPDQRVDTFGGPTPRVFARPLSIPTEQPIENEAVPLPVFEEHIAPLPVAPEPIPLQPAIDNSPESTVPFEETVSVETAKTPRGIATAFGKLRAARLRSAFGVFALAVILSAATIAGQSWLASRNKSTDKSVADTPAFSALVPEDSSNVKSHNANALLNYDPKKGVASFSDRFNKSLLTVSQQPLPAGIYDDPKVIEKVIGSIIGLRQSVDTKQGKAYIITNDEIKEQTVVLQGQQQLVFIRTTDMLKPNEWQEYINSFQSKQ